MFGFNLPANGAPWENVNYVPNLCQARHPQYAPRSDRMQTYSLWAIGIAQKPDQLTNAGFYYTGRGDRVVCFYCGGGLKDWEAGALPWTEHAAWFSSCEFVKVMKGQAFIERAKYLRAAFQGYSKASEFTHVVADDVHGDNNLIGQDVYGAGDHAPPNLPGMGRGRLPQGTKRFI